MPPRELLLPSGLRRAALGRLLLGASFGRFSGGLLLGGFLLCASLGFLPCCLLLRGLLFRRPLGGLFLRSRLLLR